MPHFTDPDALTPGEAAYESSETPASGCQNCGKQEDWFRLTDFRGEDGRESKLCRDCAAEERRIEDEAGELADRDGCQGRGDVIRAATTTRELVNRLRLHDMTCEACGAEKAA